MDQENIVRRFDDTSNRTETGNNMGPGRNLVRWKIGNAKDRIHD